MQKTVGVIGAGFAGMTAAALLAKYGYQVTVFEKNSGPGGRASLIEEAGFKFDKGPSFYWMPEIFERFFNQFNQSAADYYKLVRLDPSYGVFWQDHAPVAMPADLSGIKDLFESFEKGAGSQLTRFLEEARIKYETGMGEFVYLPSISFKEYLNVKLISRAWSLDIFKSVSSHIASYFKNPYLRQLLEFPVLFLGAKPSKTPALYSLMNYADLILGTWYPLGGMYEVSKAIHLVGVSQGVRFLFNQGVRSIVNGKQNKSVLITESKNHYEFDYIVSGADYEYTESQLLATSNQSYSSTFWENRTMAPSVLMYFLGFDRKLTGLLHHNLFFDAPFDQHAADIYDQPAWPEQPLFYTNSSSLTDPGCAPPGCHNLVALIPVSVDLKDTDEIRDRYLEVILDRISRQTGQEIRSHLIYQKSYANSDLKSDYHAFKGNAYGLANTLFQTGPLRPSIRSRKLKNLFYCGQLTVPGPGLPPALISGEIVANYIHQMNTR
ncbi:MAG: phytoene desaturase family protein [Saprospiraceae bacterium]|nr:phytoene desaturase family protein [Saprospiraceae bacterium]